MYKALFCLALLFSSPLFAGWGTPFQVYSGFSAYAPVSGIDDAGNGIVSYYYQQMQDSGAGATQIVNGAPFNPVSYVALEGPVFNVNLALNRDGNATMVWTEYSGTDSAALLRSVSFLNNAWSPVSPMANQLTDPQTGSVLANALPGITKDSSNNSIACWNLLDSSSGLEYSVGYNLLQSGTWTTQAPLYSVNSDFLPSSYLAGSPSGQGFVIWSDSGPYILQGSYYDGASWTNNLSISTDLLQNCTPAMNVSMNSSNNALIAWARNSDGGIGSILFSGGVYGPAETVYTPSAVTTTTDQLVVALNDAGTGALAWITYDSEEGERNLFMAFRINSTWQTPLLIDTSATGLSKVNIALDNNGNAYVVWCRNDESSNSSIVGANVPFGSNVIPSYVLISTENTTNARNPSLAVNGLGATLVSWETGPFDASVIEAAAGSFSGPTPPLNLAGTQVKNRFLTQTERANVLTWSASQDPSVQNYYIFRNDVFIAAVSAASALQYVDHNQTKHSTQYKVTAVNAQNIQSAPAVIIIH